MPPASDHPVQISAAQTSAAHPEATHVTAFVLAGGGSLGAIEVGMLRELLAWGESPQMLVGSSAGAINAAFFAGDPTPAGASRLERLWCELRRKDVFPFELSNLLGLLRRRNHLVGSGGLRRLLERHLPYLRLEEAALPVHIVAADILSGAEVVLSAGLVIEAVLASAAIPGVFPPVAIDGRLLVDGGVANNTPVSTAVALGATRVIVLPTGFACALTAAPSGAVAHAMHALSLLIARQLVRDAERFGDTVQLRIVPSLCPLGRSPYDYSAGESLIEQAATRTRRWLEDGGLEQGGVPMQLREHRH